MIRKVFYQMQYRLGQMLPVFHKAHVKNLIGLVVGIVHAEGVTLPRAASRAPLGSKVQLEARVQRFERLLKCGKFVPLEVLEPVARQVLEWVWRKTKDIVLIVDRSQINDTINLLYVSVAYCGRALPLGWVRVAHDGCSDLALQQELLQWVAGCLPAGCRPAVVADREFHSIWLAFWIERVLGWWYVLRIKGDTTLLGRWGWQRADASALPGVTSFYRGQTVTQGGPPDFHVNLLAVWRETEDEPWLLITNFPDRKKAQACYERRFWIEEMFSDHKSRGLNLESTRLTDPDRLQRLLVAVVLAYLWIMEIGAFSVASGQWKQVDNKGADRSVSLCRLGLRWIAKCLTDGLLPPMISLKFNKLAAF